MTVFLQLIVLLVDINYLILLYMLSNQEIIYIVYYVVERVLSLLVLGSYGAATFGVLLGFIINLGILHLLIKYNFQNLANVVLVIGILLGVISQILCFKNYDLKFLGFKSQGLIILGSANWILKKT